MLYRNSTIMAQLSKDIRKYLYIILQGILICKIIAVYLWVKFYDKYDVVKTHCKQLH